MPKVLFWIMYISSALLIGYKTYYKAISLIFKKIVNENLLVTLSKIGAICVGKYMEGLMVKVNKAIKISKFTRKIV